MIIDSRMRKVLIALLCWVNINCYASSLDSAKVDSLPVVTSFRKISAKKIRPYITPGILMGYGFMSLDNKSIQFADSEIKHEILESFQGFSTRIDDKLQYLPAAGVFALNLAGVKSKNHFVDRSIMYFISLTLMGHTVDYLKDKTHKIRPSGGDNRSFPSGHTATAFVAAEFMRQEYKDISPWYGYAGYSVAAATGAIRMFKNAHWFSDVLAGAGIGILSTKITYIGYPWIKKILRHSQQDIRLIPIYQNGKVGFSFRQPL